MNAAPSSAPLRRHVVLVGAGHSHLVFAHMFGMNPIPGVSVTLVNPSREVIYSAMVPAHVGGEYPRADISIDLVPFCRSAGVRLLVSTVTGVETGEGVAGRRVLLPERPPLGYDILCLAPGSVTTPPKPDPRAWSLRPLDALLARIAELDLRLERDQTPFHLAVIGGGASGCELALALARRYAARPAFRITLLQRNTRLIPRLPEKAGNTLGEALRLRGVNVRTNAQVRSSDEGLVLSSGETLACDAVLWAVQGHTTPALAQFGLPLTKEGFLSVRDTLQSTGHDRVFGTGDAVAFASKPELPRSGVHAVRQGPVLFANVRRAVEGQPLEAWEPQARVLYALNVGDGTAVACWGGVAWHGRFARRLKDRIDRAWIARFRPEPMAAAEDEDLLPPAMRCGGCGSKVPADVLSNVIAQLDVGNSDKVFLGARSGEDAAVHRLRAAELGAPPETLVEVQTVDHFKAFLDDPYTFGRIAALHSLSDLHAMNARPFCALAIATVAPMRGRLLEATLLEMLSGAVRTLKASGAELTGGHTTEGHELALGLAVTGYAEEARLFRKGGLKIGDALVLTKPIGTGALLAAWMRRACRGEWFEGVVRGMLKDSAELVPTLNRLEITACTDVTGFGLAGHLMEMLAASGVAARIDGRRVPRYAGFDEVVRSGVVSTLHAANARTPVLLEGLGTMPAWLHDPQTSGGLLIGIRADRADELVRALREAGHEASTAIGECVPRQDAETPLITAYAR